MDVKPRTGELIAAGSAIVLFIVMFLPWYGSTGLAADVLDQAQELGFASEIDDTRSAWESFGFIDIMLLVTIIVAVGSAVASGLAPNVALPVTASVGTTLLGILATAVVLYRVIDPPDIEGLGEVGRRFWLYLGLLATAGIAYGGWRGIQEEGPLNLGRRSGGRAVRRSR